jgi:hypothetical protein
MAKTTKKKAAPVKAAKKKAAPVKAKKAVAAKAKKAPAKATKKTTASVLQHHTRALISRQLDEIMKDYCEESLVCTPMGTARGLKEIRDTFMAALNTFTPESLANLKSIRQEINGDYAYILWSALPVVSFGGDTFHIRDGKIIMQAFISQMKP